jgi:hypothetical protein
MLDMRRRLAVTLSIEIRRAIHSGDVVEGDSKNAAYCPSYINTGY